MSKAPMLRSCYERSALALKARRDYGAELMAQAHALGLEAPTREHVFHPERRWRFDLAWVPLLVAVEIEGVTYGRRGELGGRHVSAAGFREDCEKYAEATALGWAVLRVLPAQVKSGEAIRWLSAVLAHRRVILDRLTHRAP